MRNSSVVYPPLTDVRAAKLRNIGNRSDLFIRDANLRGFGLRISPKNVKSFFVEATVHGRFTRRVLGQFPLLSVEEARKRALEALREVKYGKGRNSLTLNPQEAPITLSRLASEFLERKETVLRRSTLKDYRSVLEGDYFAPWKALPVNHIPRRSVLDRYQAICQQHGVGMANKAMRVLSAALNYAKATHSGLEGWDNPVHVLSESRMRIQSRPRTSHIPLSKLSDWLLALERYRSADLRHPDKDRREDVYLLLNLLLMTGLRSNEARSLRWADIDLERCILRVSAERAKNGIAAELPVNSWLIEELGKRQTPPQLFAFPNHSTEGYLRNLKRPMDWLSKNSGVRITPHDLRRTFATYLDELGVPFGAIKQLLNHASAADVTARYIQKRDSTELLGYSELLLKLIRQHRPSTLGSCDVRSR